MINDNFGEHAMWLQSFFFFSFPRLRNAFWFQCHILTLLCIDLTSQGRCVGIA